MPELPDVLLYLRALEPRILGRRLAAIRLLKPFLLRSVEPALPEAQGRRVTGLRRLGKRIVIGLEGDLFLVVHLMIAGRLRWREPTRGPVGRIGLAALEFDSGVLWITEAGSKRRASLHLVRGEPGLAEHDPGGLDVLEASRESFAGALRRESHTLKRVLTDPEIFSGIGNSYSDEILHRARLSPFRLTRQLDEGEVDRLRDACLGVLREWIERLAGEAGESFPEKVTAFREGMAVHGRHGQPCPACGSAVQRIVYAGNEANYCARCQTGGRLLADRALSRLLHDDWPRTLEELESRRRTPEGPDPASR